MKNRFQRALHAGAHHVIPPRLLKYQIAWRNWRRGEPEIRYLRQLVDPTRAALDVGAYLGAYTYFLRKLTGTVHAFEPQTTCCEFLRQAYGDTITVHACAVSNYSGTAEMRAANENSPSQGASLVAGEKAWSNNELRDNLVSVAVNRLDDLKIQPTGFIKIDAEGEESRVIEGAGTVLERDRPVLLVEIEQRHRQENIYEVFQAIERHGYRGKYLLHQKFYNLQTFHLDRLQTARLMGDKTAPYVNNFIFEPA